MTFVHAVSERILNLLDERNLSKYKLLKTTGLAESSLRTILKGKSKDIRLSTIAIISEGLGLTLKEFFNDKLFDTFDLEV